MVLIKTIQGSRLLSKVHLEEDMQNTLLGHKGEQVLYPISTGQRVPVRIQNILKLCWSHVGYTRVFQISKLL